MDPPESSSTRTIPTATPTGGRSQGLKAITLDDVKDFHQKHYTRESLDAGHGGWLRASDARHRSSRASLLCPATALDAAQLAKPRPPQGPGCHDRREAGRSDGHLDRLPDRRDPPRRRFLRPGRRQLVPGRAPHVQRQADAGPARQARA